MQTEAGSFNKPIKGGIYRRYIKRLMDLVLSLIALIVLSPVLLIVAALVKIKLGSPVIFKQKRPGLNERIFTLYKFRTMTDERDENGELLADEIRLTEFVKLLRSTSLDELPELWHIVRGDMSIVGPRPHLVIDLVFMIVEQRQRHTATPGLTGWAQINGRNDMTWEVKLDYDLQYINKISFALDIRIIIITVVKVFKREGINTEGLETAEDLGDYLLSKKEICKDEYWARIEESIELMIRG